MTDPEESLSTAGEDSGDGTPQGEDRDTAIRLACTQIEEGDFTGGGKPKVEALEKVLGFNISAAERDAAWAAHQGEGKDAQVTEVVEAKPAEDSGAVTIDKLLPAMRAKGMKI